MIITDKIKRIIDNAELELADVFKELNNISLFNQNKVLEAFQNNNVSQRHFSQTTGYGYDDIGRDTLCNLFKDIFHTESAIVSPLIASGTHALTIALFAVLRPNDTMLAITGAPYDTLSAVIKGDNIGSLKDYSINYKQIELLNNDIDIDKVINSIDETTKLIFIGRSRGYEWRNALGIPEIAYAITEIKKFNSDIVILVDNCYGEFLNILEPSDVGADLTVGSLNKNPGGGLAPNGGYIVGKAKWVEQAGYRLTAPSIGMEIGSYASGYLPYYQGLFMAPNITINAVKGSILMGKVFESLGFETMPKAHSYCNDIIRSIKFDTKEQLITFCQAIQKASPVDSNVVPYPWAMPGYENEVIMAAGTFIQGASIELSADSPIKEPYIAYLQGGLTYEHVKLATMYCLADIFKM